MPQWPKTDPQLMARIAAHPLDIAGSALPFTSRLARDNGWSPAFAIRAVKEYQRFAYLACVSKGPVTPSDEVDQVWHLHIQYTEDYWEVFCPEVLGRKLHHGPTRGGRSEGNRFADQYAHTLALYETEFGEAPPADLWPDHKTRFGRAPHFRRVNTREVIMIPVPAVLRNPRSTTLRMAGVSAAALLLAFLVMGFTPVPGMATSTVYWIVGSFIVFFILVWIGSFFANPDGRMNKRDRGGPLVPFEGDVDFDGDDEQ